MLHSSRHDPVFVTCRSDSARCATHNGDCLFSPLLSFQPVDFMLLNTFASASSRSRSLQRLGGLLASVTTTLFLAACGGNTDSAVNGDMSIRLSGSASTTSNGHIVAKAVSDNLLDLNRSWGTWSGETSGVTYNADTGMLSIPASSDSVAMVTAVERYELPLVAGTEYTLAVQASHPEMAAVLFLFDTNGAIVPVPGVTDSLASIRPTAPLTFVAPQNIAGLYLQVQNRWQATEDGALSADLTTQEGNEEETGNGDVIELLDPAVSWTAWDGTGNSVVYDNNAQAVVIDTPQAGAGNRHGIHRYFIALTAGDTYTLRTLNASDAGASTLLFLFDGGGALVPFANPETDTEQNWIAAAAGESVSFVAPEGITSVVVQVQSGWMASEPTRLVPSLTKQSNAGSCTPVLSGVGEAEPVAGLRTDGLIDVSTWVSTSSDGRWTVFTTQNKNFLPDEFNRLGRFWVYLYDAESQTTERILPTDPNSYAQYMDAKISGDGSTIYFISDDGPAIDGQANGVHSFDLFRYNRVQRRIYRAVTAPENRRIGVVNVSPDGQRALISGWAELIINPDELGPDLGTSRLLEYNAATNRVMARSFPAELGAGYQVASDDLTHVVYRVNSTPIYIDGYLTGHTPTEYVYRNIVTGVSSVIAEVSYESGFAASSVNHDITADGRYVVFRGNQENATGTGQQFNGRGLYRWDRTTGQVGEIVRAEGPDTHVNSPSVSDDGNIVAYRYRDYTPGVTSLSETRVTDIAANRTVSERRFNLKQVTGTGNAVLFDDERDGVNTPAFVPLQFACE